jgi:NAD(P)-dependent dehydrogenase (short-subunit alcohol dehydrogenase family)
MRESHRQVDPFSLPPRARVMHAAASKEALMGTLEGTKVVLLGGTSGIGLATAKAAAQKGAMVVVASKNRDRVATAVRAIGANAKGEVANLGGEAETRGLFDRIGPFDHLVYTAGESLMLGALESLDIDQAKRAFDIRVFGALAAVKQACPNIRKTGSIVLTHGIAGRRPMAGWSVGASICGAMEALTRALAVELSPVRVNAVSPGFVRTPLWNNFEEAAREAMYREAGAKLSRRRWASPSRSRRRICSCSRASSCPGKR